MTTNSVLQDTIDTALILAKRDKNKGEKTAIIDEMWDEFVFNQHDTTYLVQSVPVHSSRSLTIELSHQNITQMFLNISIIDGDANTEPDVIESVDFTSLNENNEEIDTSSIDGTDTTFDGQLSLNAGEDITYSQFCRIDIEIRMYASEDQWAGPIFWRGTPDTGYILDILIEYKYLESAD